MADPQNPTPAAPQSPAPSYTVIAPTGEIGDVPFESIHDAVKAGGKIGQEMLAPTGERGVVPLEGVHDAMMQGATLIGQAPGAPPAPEMKEEPIGKLGRAGLNFMRPEDADIPRDQRARYQELEKSGLLPVVEAGDVAKEGIKGLATNAAKASSINIGAQMWNYFHGQPNSLKDIPAAAVMTWLAAAGDMEGKAPIRGVADTVADYTKGTAKNVAGATGGMLGRLTGISQGWEAFKNALHGEASSDAAMEEVAHGKPTEPSTAATPKGAPSVNSVPEEEWEAGHQLENEVEGTKKPEVTKGQKAAAEKAFLEHLGKTKEDIAAAKQKQAIAYQKHLVKAARGGAEFGPRGGVTPELMEQAKGAGRAAYLKHLGIDEGVLEEAKSAGRQGAMAHYKQAMADLTGKAGAPTGVSTKVMVTKADEAALGKLGYDQATIAKMKPAEAGEILTNKTTAVEHRNNQALVDALKKAGPAKPNVREMSPDVEAIWQQSKTGQAPPKPIDTEAYRAAGDQAKRELGIKGSLVDLAKDDPEKFTKFTARREQIAKAQGKAATTGDAGTKARQANPEPPRGQ